ncbi:MAG TPA: hypothetical protein VND93_03620, partial [Myxococcales bacterium]|nr:hypothetical protein [Myxococcales bacterium]
EAGLTPNLSVMGLAIPAAILTSRTASLTARLGFGVRYFFFGDAPAGFYTGGLLLGGTPSVLQPGAPFSIGGELQVGYTWVWDGFTLGLGSSLYLSSGSFSPFGIGLTIPIGWTW